MKKKIIKKCTGCNTDLSFNDIQFIGYLEYLALFNCKHCRSTVSVKGISVNSYYEGKNEKKRAS